MPLRCHGRTRENAAGRCSGGFGRNTQPSLCSHIMPCHVGEDITIVGAFLVGARPSRKRRSPPKKPGQPQGLPVCRLPRLLQQAGQAGPYGGWVDSIWDAGKRRRRQKSILSATYVPQRQLSANNDGKWPIKHVDGNCCPTTHHRFCGIPKRRSAESTQDPPGNRINQCKIKDWH